MTDQKIAEEFTHPMREAELHTFCRSDTSDTGVKWVARFYPYKTYPIIISGESEDEVIEKAEKFRRETVDHNESGYVNRRNALEKSRASKAKNKAT